MRVGIGHDTHRLDRRPAAPARRRPRRASARPGRPQRRRRGAARRSPTPCSAPPASATSATPIPTPIRLARTPTRALFLRETLARLNRAGWRVVNVDVIIFAQEPKLGPVKAAIRANLARLLGLAADAVNVKAKTGERVGHIGRAEAHRVARSVALIERTSTLTGR